MKLVTEHIIDVISKQCHLLLYDNDNCSIVSNSLTSNSGLFSIVQIHTAIRSVSIKPHSIR